MRADDVHLLDEDLIRLADGELSIWKRAGARRHLAKCGDCRARMSDIEKASVDFVRMYHEDVDVDLPPISDSRARLVRQLAVSGEKEPSRVPSPSAILVWSTVALAVCLLAVLGAAALKRRTLERESPQYAGLLPNRRLTPGVTRPVRIVDICSMRNEEVVRPVSEDLQRKVLQEYRLSNASVENYEIDYLITPGLGGADAVGNLWPEPKYGAAWNSFAKDALEDRLHQLVCSGQISLDEAQEQVSIDWIAAYKKYFHASQPL
jgi:hypothetical protein